MRRYAILLVAILILGIFLIWGGEWLLWDWINSIIHGPWLNMEAFCSEWTFPSPFFAYTWRCQKWTEPYDLAKLMLDIGCFTTIISAFTLGIILGRRRK